MKIVSFEEIRAWIRSKELTVFLYTIFSDNKDCNYKNQILRASVSIMSNIAEGFEKGSNADFKKYLYISKGSCAEVRSLLILGYELKYIPKEKFDICYGSTIEIGKMLSSFIKTL